MVEVIEAILADPLVRSYIEGVTLKIVADILSRRAADPDFLAKSGAAFAALSSANTPEGIIDAQNTLRLLLASP